MVTFKKPDIRYVDMCIWIDNNAYESDCDDNTLFEYLYHLCYMLASQQKLFSRYEYYDDFAIYAATKSYFRLKNKNQFREDNPLPKVKSILNYLKSVLYPMKVAFEQEEYSESVQPNNDYSIQFTSVFDLAEYADNIVDTISISDFKLYMNDVSKTIKNYIYKMPYIEDEILMANIYESCLLTILNWLTISVEDKLKLKEMLPVNQEKGFNDILTKNKDLPPILYHLDKSYNNYIILLSRRALHLVCQDLSQILNQPLSTNIVQKDFINYCVEDM